MSSLRRPLPAVVATLAATTLLAGCGSSPATTRSERRGGTTLVTYAASASCVAPQTVTALVSRDDKGCFLLQGYPVAFPQGTTWADRAGASLRLPSGATLRAGDSVTGQVCQQVPQPLEATYDCDIAATDPTHGLRTVTGVRPAP